MLSFTTGHGELFVLDKVKVIEPKAVSDELGIYVAFKVLSFGLKLPLPVLVQIPVDV